jgi:hypothetical protein
MVVNTKKKNVEEGKKKTKSKKTRKQIKVEKQEELQR